MFEKSYLRSTGQLWKVAIFMVAPICGIILVALSIPMMTRRTPLSVSLLLGGIFFALAGPIASK